MFHFDFLIPRRPVSVQASNRAIYQGWMSYVREVAATRWVGPAIKTGEVRLTLVFLCGEASIDVDNIIKPIQDALIGLVYADDGMVTDVDSHRRFVRGVDTTGMPPDLLAAALAGMECVYVRVEDAPLLERFL